MPGGHVRRTAVAAIVLGALAIGACSGDDDDSAPSTTSAFAAECVAKQPVLRVDLIGTAVAAVEQELGGPQRYFEINATDLLVNLFVSIDDGTRVKPYVYIDGQLSSKDPLEGTPQGGSFVGSTLDFDPQKVTSCVTEQLPESDATAFEIVANAEGAVRYSVITTSPQGGQLVVVVSSSGQVLSVDPVT
jgi:hypothetical protein